MSPEVQRLGWLIGEVEDRAAGQKIHLARPEFLNEFVVTSSWLDVGLNDAKRIFALIAQDLSQAIGPLHRALWELWIDWRYLLKFGDRALNAAKVILSAELEALQFLAKHPHVLLAVVGPWAFAR